MPVFIPTPEQGDRSQAVYPACLTTVDLSSSQIAFWVTDIADASGNLGSLDATARSSLLAAIKTWAEGYDWGDTVTGFSITQYAETTSNVTP